MSVRGAGMPNVVNRTPAEGEEFSPTLPIYFGVRDDDYQVDPGEVYGFVTFAKAVFDPPNETELPLSEPYVFDVFSDSLPIERNNNRADLTFETVSGDVVLSIASASAVKSSNVLFLHGDVTKDAPVGCELRFAVPVIPSAGPSAYLSDTDYNGVLFGYIHWDRSTGIFVFCGDSAGTKYVRITGPADSSGVRAVNQTVNFDWSAATHSFRIFFEASGYLARAIVTVTDETTKEETRLFDEPISALGKFIPTARIGLVESQNPSAGSSVFFGLDQERVGEAYLYSMLLEEHGETLVSAGGVEAFQEGTAEASGCLIAASQADVARMRRESASWIPDTDFLLLTANETTNSRLRSEEPQLQTSKWLVFFRGRPQQEEHGGSYNIGMGFDISNGVDALKFRFLNDGTTSFGMYTNALGSNNRLITENYETAEVDWSETAPFILTVFDGTQVLCSIAPTAAELVIGGSFTSTDLSGLSDAEGLARFDIGFLDQEDLGPVSFDGIFAIENFIFMPVKEVAYAGDFSAWTYEGSAPVSIVDDVAVIEPDASDLVGFYHISFTADEYTEYVTGIAVSAQAKIVEIVDQLEQVDPVRMASAALMAVRASAADTFVQLQFVTAEDRSETFVFVSQDTQDVLEVLNPESEVGRLISAPIDLSVEHTYLLVILPGKSVRLFIDFEEEPSIDIPWADSGSAKRATVDNILDGKTVSIGSIPTLKFGSVYNRMSVNLRSAAVGLGSGYDYAVTLQSPRSVLESKIYGAKANVFIDLTDTA